ncbi:MAG TPA: isoprenylcysteine carboxylmethyltransferase family protein [Anaerolineaceae bacterium]|nr:isoprenylcysteine carboxylmethyltransferase family protein [Anaerolineaceae bacterium]
MTVQVAGEQQVITTGPYAVVRHPMYAGGSLLVLAAPVALGSWAALPLAVLPVLALVLRLLDEEKVLTASLSGYRDYQHQVPYRLVPGLW